VRESVPTNEPEAQNRRSTRIVQAVPLTVIGVDALGRPFQERTSTLIINCHGCRYQSKHYVLKNMWVTLEVPHPEAGRPPRNVRGRVMWIQRPRTVRELFQVGVELEVSGNFWGIAFPPADWFPFPEGVATVPAPPIPAPSPAPALPVEDAWPTPSPAVAPESNVRTLPLVPSFEPAAPAVEASAAAQVTKVVEEAKQELQALVRRSAAEAVSLEARPLIAQLEPQLKNLAEKMLEMAVGPLSEKAFEHAKQVQVDAFLQECSRGMAESANRAAQQFASQLDELEKDRSATFEHRLGKVMQEALERFQKQAADMRPQAPPVAPESGSQPIQVAMPNVEEFEERVRAQLERASASLSEIEAAAQGLHEQATSAFTHAQSDWKSRVDTDLSAATDRWHQQVEGLVESAKQHFVDKLARHAQSASEHIERELGLRTAQMSKAFAEAANEAEVRLNTLRSSFEQENERGLDSVRKLQMIENQIQNYSASLDGITHAAEQAFHRRADVLLELQSQEMTRRAEQAINLWAERLQPALEATGQQTVTRLAAQIKADLNDRLHSAGTMISRLENAIAASEQDLHKRQEIMARASEQASKASHEHLKELVNALSCEFQESVRAATEKSIAEIESKATDTTHHAFESLFKTAEWYEKKVHTQMQAAIDKGMENALAALKDKAGEISSIFGSELDHYSRSYVQHTQQQVEETALESLERMRKQAEEMAAASADAIVQHAREDADTALQEFRAKADNLSTHIRMEFEAQIAQFQKASDVDSGKLSAEFRAALKLQVQDELSGARKEFRGQLEAARQELSLEFQSRQQTLADNAAALSDNAIEEYRRKLEAASNSWLLTTVAKLSQRTDQHVQMLTKAAEERLRAACTEVFSGVGDALRRGLLDINPPPAAPQKTDE
jgi:hypothetical protein